MPNFQQIESIKMNGDLYNELAQLKQDMKFKDGTDILLSLSMVSDEMMHVVYMLREVAYMAVTLNTNSEGRDSHLLVVKDANGETFKYWVCKNNLFSAGIGIHKYIFIPPEVIRQYHQVKTHTVAH